MENVSLNYYFYVLTNYKKSWNIVLEHVVFSKEKMNLNFLLCQDGFAQRKEERFVDYYRVPRNKSLKDGQFLSHGIHLVKL